MIDENLRIVLKYCLDWFCNHGKPMRITSLLRPYGDGISRSTTHQEGRAADISILDLSEIELKQFESDIVARFGYLGAISKETGHSKIIETKKHGTGPHAHIQVRPTRRKT